MRPRRLALAALCALAAGCGRTPARPPEILGEIGNEYLTTDEFMHHFKMRGGLELAGPARDELKRMLLAELVERRLLLLEARRRRIQPAREDVRRAFGELGGAGWDAADRAAAWNAQDDLYEQRQIEELVRVAVPRPDPPGRAVVAAWLAVHPEAARRPAQVRLRQIVVHSSAMANEIKAALDKGEALGTVARRLGLGGAEPAWLGEDSLPPEVWEAARGGSVGAVLGPVASDFGYHLAVVDARRDGGALPVAEAQALARRRLGRERRDAAFRGFVTGLRRAAVIRVDRAAVDRL